jgi:hypothetical protein
MTLTPQTACVKAPHLTACRLQVVEKLGSEAIAYVLIAQACFRHHLWSSLLSLASTWSGAREAPVAAAASTLYVALFVVFDSSLERQQVLHALHGHLGSGVSGKQDVALKVR